MKSYFPFDFIYFKNLEKHSMLTSNGEIYRFNSDRVDHKVERLMVDVVEPMILVG